MVVSRLTPKTAVALGFSQSARSLQQQLARYSKNAFLVARDPLDRAGFHSLTGTSVGVRHDFGLTGLSLTSERGKVSSSDLEPRIIRPDYAMHAMTLDRRLGPAHLILGLTRMKEEQTVLGSRFSTLFLRGGSSSSFVDGAASADLGRGWSVSGSYRRGWTKVGGTGDLADKGALRTEAFGFDVAKTSLFAGGDKLAFRITQPLRVTKGGFDLNVPIAYDYKTGETTFGQRFFNLAPTGREIDYEVAYGLGLFGGSLDFNAFVRTDPGHIEAMRRDAGAAIRFTLSN